MFCYAHNDIIDGMEEKRIGKLVVTRRLPKSKYLCRCDCGNERIVNIGHFNTGDIKSCGCHWWHGHAGSSNRSNEYTSYHNMLGRCYDKKNKRYSDYGGRGIVVCDSWRISFKDFLQDMGLRPDGFVIDRIDNTQGYSKQNCRWLSRSDSQWAASYRIIIMPG